MYILVVGKKKKRIIWQKKLQKTIFLKKEFESQFPYKF